MFRVRSFQRALLGSSVVVGCVVGVVGYRVWNDMKERSAALVSSKVSGKSVSESDGEKVTVTRVLVRRRLGHPEEEGVVVETQFLGVRVGRDGETSVAAAELSTQDEKQGADTVASKAKRLPMMAKVIAFGGLVAAFVAFNAWAVPKLVPKRVIPSFDPVLSGSKLPGRVCFVELGSGDGGAVMEAAKHFEEAHGFEQRGWLLRLAKKQHWRQNPPAHNVFLHRGSSGWEELVARADCVLVSQSELLERAKALMKADSVMLLQEGEVFIAQKIGEQHQ